MSRQRRVRAPGYLVARACVMYRHACRFVHVSCVVEANRHRKDDHDTCPTCKQGFVGALQMAAAEARVHTTCLDRNFDPAAVEDLAVAFAEKGSYAEALGLFRKVLEFQQRYLGRDHLEPAKTKVNIGLVYSSMGEYEKALNFFNEALPVLETKLGRDHLETAKAYNKCVFIPFDFVAPS